MATTNQSLMQKSVLDINISFSCELLTNPILLSVENGDKIMDISDPDDLVHREITANGDISAYVTGTQGKGALCFQPNATAIKQIDSFQKIISASGIIVPGTITIESSSFSYTLNNVTFTKNGFVPYSFSKYIEYQMIPFEYSLPSDYEVTSIEEIIEKLKQK